MGLELSQGKIKGRVVGICVLYDALVLVPLFVLLLRCVWLNLYSRDILDYFWWLLPRGPQQVDKHGSLRSAYRIFVVWITGLLARFTASPFTLHRHMLIGTSARPLFVGSSVCMCQVVSIETTFQYVQATILVVILSTLWNAGSLWKLQASFVVQTLLS